MGVIWRVWLSHIQMTGLLVIKQQFYLFFYFSLLLNNWSKQINFKLSKSMLSWPISAPPRNLQVPVSTFLNLYNRTDLAANTRRWWHQWDIFCCAERISASLKNLIKVPESSELLRPRCRPAHVRIHTSNHPRTHLLHNYPSVRPSRDMFGWNEAGIVLLWSWEQGRENVCFLRALCRLNIVRLVG